MTLCQAGLAVSVFTLPSVEKTEALREVACQGSSSLYMAELVLNQASEP